MEKITKDKLIQLAVERKLVRNKTDARKIPVAYLRRMVVNNEDEDGFVVGEEPKKVRRKKEPEEMDVGAIIKAAFPSSVQKIPFGDRRVHRVVQTKRKKKNQRENRLRLKRLRGSVAALS